MCSSDLIIGTIKSPEYLYHQPIFDFLNSVKNGLGSNLVKDLLQREIQAKSSEQKNGVILKDIVDIKTQLNDASLSIEPFTIEEYRDEFELRFSALEISFPLKKELEGSIRGSVILSLSADFLKKNLPLKSDFKQSFTRELVFNGPLTMPLSRASLDSFRNDLIALVATQMDMKTLEIDLKAKVKSIESEAKDVFKSFINGTSDKKLEKLKDTREAFKGLLKGLIKPNPKSTDLK